MALVAVAGHRHDPSMDDDRRGRRARSQIAARTCTGKRRFTVEHGTPSLDGRSSIHVTRERHYFECARAGTRRLRSARR
jgi:hypothetical protein